MLILGRKVGQSVTIECPTGEKLRIVVLERRSANSKTHLKLGFDGPTSVQVLRDELERHEAPDEKGGPSAEG